MLVFMQHARRQMLANLVNHVLGVFLIVILLLILVRPWD